MDDPMTTYPFLTAQEAARPRVCVVNLGCKVNRVESDWMESAFVDAGARLVNEEEADIVVVNTCGVTAEAQAKTRKAIRRAASQPNAPLVAVTGCVANLFPNELAALHPHVHLYPVKHELVDQVLSAWRGERSIEPPTCDNHPASPSHGTFRSRRGVKVQDGCDNRCTYCIVWKARGPVRSEPLDRIEQQVARALAEGADEIVLSGINLGRFSAPNPAGEKPLDLGGLIDRVCALGPKSVRLSSIEPPDFGPRVVEAMVRNAGQVAAHVHLPLQSGSDSVLARMGRHYTTRDFANRVAGARAALPGLSLSTDIIVGFPGETDKEFSETLAFCRAMAFSKIHIFRYSARPGTPAAAMEAQVEAGVIKIRSEALHALAAQLRAADAQSRVGTCEPVLVEYVDDSGEARGTSASYHDVVLPAGSHRLEGPGFIRCTITAIDEQGRLIGAVR